MSDKKVEVFKVVIKTIDKSQLNFEEILLNTTLQNIDKKTGSKHIQLAYVEDKGEYVVGMIQTTKMMATPPKRNVVTNVTSALGLVIQEGLLYGNVFLYVKAKQTLLYEVTKDSLYAGQLDDFIYALVKDSGIIAFDIRFNLMMNVDAMKKLLKMGSRKSVHIQFANPDDLLKKVKDSQRSIKEIAKPGKDIGAELIDVTYKISGNKDKYLQNNAVDRMLEFITEKYNLLRDNVKMFSIKGYEDNEEKITEIDIVKDKMVETIKYQEHHNMKDLKPFQRKQEIIAAYLRLENDINSY